MNETIKTILEYSSENNGKIYGALLREDSSISVRCYSGVFYITMHFSNKKMISFNCDKNTALNKIKQNL